jgi:hypothetical protein
MLAIQGKGTTMASTAPNKEILVYGVQLQALQLMPQRPSDHHHLNNSHVKSGTTMVPMTSGC